MIVTESRTQLPKCHLLELSLRELAVYIHDEQPNTSAAKVGERRVQGIAEEPFSFLTTSLSSLFVSGHRNTPTTGTTRVDINTTRGDHRNALPPRRRVGPEAAPSSRAAARELVALAAASSHIYYTPCGSPRKHQNSGASSRGIRGILPSVHRYLASLHVEPRRPVPVFSGRRPLSRALLPSLSAAFSAQRI